MPQPVGLFEPQINLILNSSNLLDSTVSLPQFSVRLPKTTGCAAAVLFAGLLFLFVRPDYLYVVFKIFDHPVPFGVFVPQVVFLRKCQRYTKSHYWRNTRVVTLGYIDTSFLRKGHKFRKCDKWLT